MQYSFIHFLTSHSILVKDVQDGRRTYPRNLISIRIYPDGKPVHFISVYSPLTTLEKPDHLLEHF